jgi:sugar O-acyltransferase (sialic acid O-acetyltransferase NeuD family)
VKGIVIVGAGGFGREVLTLVRDIDEATPGKWDFLGFLSSDPPDADLLQRIGAQYLGADSDEELLASLRGCSFVAAIGACATRRAVTLKMIDAGLIPATLVHPTAVVGEDVQLGAGTVVCAGAILTTNIRTGLGAQINLVCTVGHDTALGNFATLAPGALISGNGTLADEVYMGTNSCTVQGVSIGEGTIVGAGAVVTRNIGPGLTVVGAPAKPING